MGFWTLVAIVSAVATWGMASRRGRQPILWSVGALFFPVITPILLYALEPEPRTLTFSADRPRLR